MQSLLEKRARPSLAKAFGDQGEGLTVDTSDARPGPVLALCFVFACAATRDEGHAILQQFIGGNSRRHYPPSC